MRAQISAKQSEIDDTPANARRRASEILSAQQSIVFFAICSMMRINAEYHRPIRIGNSAFYIAS